MAAAYAQINDQNERDLVLMESIAIPLSFAVVVWVWGGVVAAELPMVLGVGAILATMSVLRLISVIPSTYAPDLSIAVGRALAIDYNLLIITRYREELARCGDRQRALHRTMATAATGGRTVGSSPERCYRGDLFALVSGSLWGVFAVLTKGVSGGASSRYGPDP
jgi:RND superfamily putative drug exporter